MMLMLELDVLPQAHDRASTPVLGSWEPMNCCHFEAEEPPGPGRLHGGEQKRGVRALAGMVLRVLEYAKCWLTDQCNSGDVSAVSV